MAPVVVVHGIGQQREGGETLHARYFPALRQGVIFAGGTIGPDTVVFADYGILFRPPAEVLSPDPWFDASDVADEFEKDLVRAWWERAAAADPAVPPPDDEFLMRSPSWGQASLAALCGSSFLAGLGEAMLVGDLKQVRSYMQDPELRQQVRDQVAKRVGPDTRVIVGHSLGSVVAYEVLCAQPESRVHTLVTLGSPLGLRMIFDRLEPRPRTDSMSGKPRGAWPGPVRSWTNIADKGDVVAAVEDLRPLFGDAIRQIRVHNGAHAHDMSPYLTDKRTGQAITDALAG